MNSSDLYRALRGHIDRRITGELRRQIGKAILGSDWKWRGLSWNQREPSMPSLMDNSWHLIEVTVSADQMRLFEVRADAIGNMYIRAVSEWRAVI